MLIFAHRGGRSLAWPSSVRAFGTALRRGAGGLESDVVLTSDGVPVLSHSGRSRTGVRVRRHTRAQLGRTVTELADLYRACGTGFALSLDVGGLPAARAAAAVAARHGAAGRLHLMTTDAAALAAWRAGAGGEFRVGASRPRLPADPRLADLVAGLAAAGVAVLNAPAGQWTPARVALVHAAGLQAFAWRVRSRRALARAAALGLDAVYVDSLRLLAWPTYPLRSTT